MDRIMGFMGVTRSRVLVGRDREVAQLGEVWARAREGLPQVVVVRGEAGIGKSSLVRHWIWGLDTDESKTLVAWGHGVPLSGGELPYGLVADLLTDLVSDLVPSPERDAEHSELPVAALAPLMPGLLSAPSGLELGRRGAARGLPAGVGSEDEAASVDRLAVFNAAQQLVRRMARDRSLVLVVEDMHWADRASADLLLFLARTLPSAPVVFVATSRDHGVEERVGSLIDALEHAPGATTLRLGPLDEQAVLSQVRDISGQTSPEVLARVWSLSEGNPLYVEELLASGVDRVPVAVRVDLSVRLNAVSEEGRRLVRIGALEHRPFDPVDLATVTDTSEDFVDAVMDQAVQVGLLEPASRTTWRFHHELLREAVADTLPASHVRTAHRRWGELFAFRGKTVDDAVAAADHLCAADAGRAAFDAVVRAARMTERHQRGRESTHWWRRALALDAPETRVATSTEHDEVLGRVLLFSDRDACLELLRAEEQAPHDASSLRLDWMRLERAALASRHLDVTATRLRNEDVAALRSHVESLPASILTYRALLAAFILQRDDEGPRELDRTLAALRRVADAFPDDMELHFGAYATSAEVALRRGQGWEEIRTKALQAVDRVPPHRSGPRVMFETEIAGFEASLGWFDQAMERARACLAQIPGPEADERWYKTPLVLAVSMTFRGEWEEARRWLDVCVAQRTFQLHPARRARSARAPPGLARS